MKYLKKHMIYILSLFIIQSYFGCELKSENISSPQNQLELADTISLEQDEKSSKPKDNKQTRSTDSNSSGHSAEHKEEKKEIDSVIQPKITKSSTDPLTTPSSDKRKEIVKKPEKLNEKEILQPVNTEEGDSTIVTFDHSIFDELTRNNIDENGAVNYAQLKKKEATLDQYLTQLASDRPTDSWERNEQLAYWINAYNAFTIKLILKNYPVAHITDLNDGDPWKVMWIKLGDKNYSLNNIEHDIIRPQFNEPRIHFAVNCAAKSCPPIQNKAYTSDNLEDLLDKSTRSFVNNSKFNRISPNKAELSKIFEWYAEDFEDLKAFVNQYSDIKLGKNASVSYLDYDWSLNGE